MGTKTELPSARKDSQTRHRTRRWPWIALGVAGGVLLAAILGTGWYVSGLLGDAMRSEHSPAEPDLIVNSVADGRVEYTYDAGYSGWIDQGLLALSAADGGWTQTSDPQASGTGSRAIGEQQSPPALSAGQRGRFDGDFFYRDPEAGLGLDYRDVVIDTPLGPAPAWFVPGDKKTWVIFIHGRNGERAESLRTLSTTADEGYPTLAITYRNDEGAPAGNGYVHFGSDEWLDLQAAARYALDQGAEQLILVGYSMGGGIALSFMANSDVADSVTGMFLDTPIASVPQQIQLEADEMGLPGFVVELGKWLAELRFGADYSATDYTAAAAQFDVPTAVIQGGADETVDPRITRTYADAVNAAHPGTVVYEVFPSAEHVGSWNVDRPRYERILTDLLDRAGS